METYPELNVTIPMERHINRQAFTILGKSDFDLAYFAAAFAATSDLRRNMDVLQAEVLVNGPRSDADTLEELYAFDALPDLDALAEAQGITPVTNFEDLLGDAWPEDESVEDFIAAATEGRHEQETFDP